ncbi:MAG: DUF1844 domain-containing protein [Phycisphaerae bacterium]|nr:DUF1844 domain-containing protein [Phycisphaerae bacterium]
MPEPTILGPDGNPTRGTSPALHVDSNWKAQAHAEKERLGRLEEEKSRERANKSTDNPDELPPADLKSLIGVLASQAVMGLGAYGDEQGRVVIDLPGSRFAIDLIGVLEEKTKGNLSAEESKHLQAVLGELRSRFVQIAAMVAQQMKAQAAGGPGLVGDLGAAGAERTAGRIDATPAARRPVIEMP